MVLGEVREVFEFGGFLVCFEDSMAFLSWCLLSFGVQMLGPHV